METDSKPSKPKAQDRVNLGEFEAEKLNRWLVQINSSSRGFLALTKTDVVNFLIRQHSEELLPKELLQIRAQHYDPVRHLNWIAPQIRMALANGDLERVAELQKELRGVELSVVHDAKAGNRKVSSLSNGKSSKRRKQGSKSEPNLMAPSPKTQRADDQFQSEISTSHSVSDIDFKGE